MTTVSQLSLRARSGTVNLDPDRASLRLDEATAPFARASLTVPLDPATVEQLDPRLDPRVDLTLDQVFSGSVPLADLSAEYAGQTLADLSAEYAGQTLADLSRKYGRAWNVPAFRPSRRVRMDLGIRDRVINHAAATVDLELASDEALLQDYGLLASSAVSPGVLTALGCVELALGRTFGAYTLQTVTGSQAITADAARWEPGVSAWQYLTPITASAGLRLWCDELRVWHLAAPETIERAGNATLSATGTVRDASDTVSRDGTEWFDGVVVTYTWTDGSNVRHVQHDIAGDETSSRVLHINHDTPFPRAGEAAARLRKVQGRGRVLSVRAVADPEVYPAQPASLSIPLTPTQTGYVQAVQWSIPEDVMDVTTRGLVDTPARSWLFGPEGKSWDSVPPGVSWETFDWEDVP